MERSIIHKFQRLHVLPKFGFKRMDELVHDLTSALEESSRSAGVSKSRKRRGLKRRPKPAINLGQKLVFVNEDSESSLDEARQSKDVPEGKHQHQTDSDGQSSSGCLSVLNHVRYQPPQTSGTFAESDSVNENFSPVRPHRRKWKFKRMAVDPSPLLGTDHVLPIQQERRNKQVKVLKHRGDIENVYRALQVDSLGVSCGKRKRNMRERSVEYVMNNSSVSDTGNHSQTAYLNVDSLNNEERYMLELRRKQDNDCHMDCSNATQVKHIGESSSSLSSSESDAGVYTNDEGREGDDEQSDFYYEPGPACGVPGVLPWWESESRNGATGQEMDPEFHAILTGSFQHLSCRSQQAFHERMRNLNANERHLRSGRRRLYDRRPGFSIVSSFNEKISKFLQDPEQSELRLHPVRKKERDQLNYIASLYSLNMKNEGKHNNPVLTKTRNTTQAVCVDQFAFPNPLPSISNDTKRRKKTDLFLSDVVVGGTPAPIGEANIGNVMLRNMGWTPGSGLGAQSSGIQQPIQAVVRPRLQGLGFGCRKADSS